MIKRHAPELVDDVKSGYLSLNSAYNEAIQRAELKQKAKNSPPTKDGFSPIFSYDGEKAEVKTPMKVVFNKTGKNVDWADYTWNPVTGCEHGCKFCYAKDIANQKKMQPYYPMGFKPVFHKYRLEASKNTPLPKDKSKRRVFVCSMADLFGKWVPDKWIEKVFHACMEAPEWEFMFLTKWPRRYNRLEKLPNAWFGASVIKQSDVARVEREMKSFNTSGIKWISLEPMLEPIQFSDLSWCDLVVIGSQTAANGQPAFSPEFDWIVDVINQCRAAGVRYYLKPNLMELAPRMKLPRNLPQLKMFKAVNK